MIDQNRDGVIDVGDLKSMYSSFGKVGAVVAQPRHVCMAFCMCSLLFRYLVVI